MTPGRTTGTPERPPAAETGTDALLERVRALVARATTARRAIEPLPPKSAAATKPGTVLRGRRAPAAADRGAAAAPMAVPADDRAGDVDIETLLQRIATLAEAQHALDEALAEAMADAVVAGASVRLVAERAGLAPNSVAPRLARTGGLGAYARGGRVGTEGVARARYDAEQSGPAAASAGEDERPPPRFTRRRPTRSSPPD